MADSYTTVNLSELQAPDVVETLDYEAILAAMLADLQARDPAFNALVESDPAYKILEVAAYRELLLRQRVNDAAKAVMLAFAVGADLDQIGANFNIQRLVLDSGDPAAVPPVSPTYETDTDFRARIQLALEGITTAGSEGSYVFHGLSADGDVKDIRAVSPTPGVVDVYVLSRSGNGAAATPLLNTVNAALNAEQVRPLTDQVTVYSAEIITFSIEAKIYVASGPDQNIVQDAVVEALSTMLDSKRRIGERVSLSSIYAALHQPGVDRAELLTPTEDIVTEITQAPYCSGFVVELEVAA